MKHFGSHSHVKYFRANTFFFGGGWSWKFYTHPILFLFIFLRHLHIHFRSYEDFPSLYGGRSAWIINIVINLRTRLKKRIHQFNFHSRDQVTTFYGRPTMLFSNHSIVYNFPLKIHWNKYCNKKFQVSFRVVTYIILNFHTWFILSAKIQQHSILFVPSWDATKDSALYVLRVHPRWCTKIDGRLGRRVRRNSVLTARLDDMCVCSFTNPSTRAGCDKRLIFKAELNRFE